MALSNAKHWLLLDYLKSHEGQHVLVENNKKYILLRCKNKGPIQVRILGLWVKTSSLPEILGENFIVTRKSEDSINWKYRTSFKNFKKFQENNKNFEIEYTLDSGVKYTLKVDSNDKDSFSDNIYISSNKTRDETPAHLEETLIKWLISHKSSGDSATLF